MQSSATVACRAGVLLACLVAIPLAALFGTRLPGLAQGLLSRPSDSTRVSDRDSLCEAPPFGPAFQPAPWDCPTETAGLASGPMNSSTEGDLRGPWAAGSSGASPGPFSDPIRAGDVVPAGYDSPDEPTFAFEPNSPDMVPAERTRQKQVSAQAEGRSPPLTDPQASPAPTPQSPQANDRLAYVQQRLRELGATYYVLETWGDKGQYYRFHAKMAVGAGVHYVRHFQATDTDPLAAMAKVLEQVETWRAGQ